MASSLAQDVEKDQTIYKYPQGCLTVVVVCKITQELEETSSCLSNRCTGATYCDWGGQNLDRNRLVANSHLH